MLMVMLMATLMAMLTLMLMVMLFKATMKTSSSSLSSMSLLWAHTAGMISSEICLSVVWDRSARAWPLT
jgi:hypothetical protein